MKLELMLGLRYLRAKKKFSFVSVITIICILGIFIGDMVMITVLSVMNGFQDDIRDKILGMRSHIDIAGYSDSAVDSYDYIMAVVDDNEDVESSYPYIMIPSIMRSHNFTTLITTRSFPQYAFEKDKDFVKYFNFLEGSNDLSASKSDMNSPNKALIGSEMAFNYGLKVGSVFDIVSAAGNFQDGFKPKKETFKVSGIYKTGYYEYDSKMVIVPMEVAASMAGYSNAVTGIAVKTKNYIEADEVASKIDEDLGANYSVLSWMSFDRNFFQALHTEKLMLGLILSFIILIAALNIASSQIIFVKDKRRDIAILKTLGLKPFGIAKVFFLEGAIIGLIGTILGVSFGLLLATHINESLEALRMLLQVLVSIIWFIPSLLINGVSIPIVPEFFPADVYYVTKGLPSIINYGQVMFVALISFVLSVLFAIIPAYMASRYKPAEILRYE